MPIKMLNTNLKLRWQENKSGFVYINQWIKEAPNSKDFGAFCSEIEKSNNIIISFL